MCVLLYQISIFWYNSNKFQTRRVISPPPTSKRTPKKPTQIKISRWNLCFKRYKDPKHLQLWKIYRRFLHDCYIFRQQYKTLVLKCCCSSTQLSILLKILGFTSLYSQTVFALHLLVAVISRSSNCTLQWFIFLPVPLSYSQYLSQFFSVIKFSVHFYLPHFVSDLFQQSFLIFILLIK